jgi:hydroxymethylpyrimidine pyrophosphatase-like HAD family hydrolase
MRDHRPAVRPGPEFPVRMLALDIDGTLVGPDVRLSDRTRDVIGEAVRRGVKVSLATGRMPSSATVFALQLGLSDPVIGHQGAIVRAMPEVAGGPVRHDGVIAAATADPSRPPFRGPVGRLLHHEPMRPEVIRDAIAWCLANGLDPHVNHLERILVQEGDPHFADYSAYLGKDAEVVPDLAAAIDRPMSKVISVGVPPRPMELIAEARRQFAGRATATVSHPRFLEFTAPGVSKGRAVAWLAHRAGIPMGNVLTMGDALNDLDMIRDAGHGAAMTTAPDEVRQHARYIAGPVEEDGAARIIEDLVLASPSRARRNAARLEEEARALGAVSGGRVTLR